MLRVRLLAQWLSHDPATGRDGPDTVRDPADEPDGLQAKDAIARVEATMELTRVRAIDVPEQPGLVRFPKLLRFSTINAVKAGWLRKKGGIWTLTEDGRAALEAFPDPEALVPRVPPLVQGLEGQSARVRAPDDTRTPKPTPTKAVDRGHYA